MRFLGNVLDDSTTVKQAKERRRMKPHRMTKRQWKFIKTVDMLTVLDKFFKKNKGGTCHPLSNHQVNQARLTPPATPVLGG